MDRLTITIPEAAELLGCSRNHAYVMAREGILPTLRLGGKLVVPKARFMAWLEEGGPSATDS